MTNPGTLTDLAKALGVSRQRVSYKVSRGQIREGLELVDGRWIVVDMDAAVRAFRAATDLSKAPHAVVKLRASADGAAFDLAAEAAREKHWRANLAELEYRVRSGELVPVGEVEEAFVAAVTAAKTKLLGLSRRIRQRLPHIDAADVRVIHDLVRESLEDLAYAR